MARQCNIHSRLLVHYVYVIFRTEYFIIIDKIMIKYAMMMGSSSAQEDRKPLHLLHGPLRVLSSSGNSHHHRLFSHYLINHNEIISSKIGTCVIYWSSRMYGDQVNIWRQLPFNYPEHHFRSSSFACPAAIFTNVYK